MTIIKTFEQPEKKSHSKKYIGLCLISLTFLIVLQVWANNTLAIYGDKFDSVSRLQQSIMLENQLLQNQIAEYSSLSNIASKSATLGLSKPKNVQYLP